MAVRNVRRDVMHDLRELKKRGRGRLRRRAPRRGRAAEADRLARRRDRRGARRQGRGDPRGVSRAPSPRRATSRSSPTGTGAGHRQRGLPVLAGHQAGADVVKARLRDAVRARDQGADGLLVLDRELDPPARRGRRADGDVRASASTARRRSSTRRACGCASSAAATGSPPSCCGAWTGPRRRPRGNDAHHPVRGLQLRRQGGDRGRGANLHGGDRGGLPAPPLRARHARSRPPDPHERRAAHLELPALAVRLLGVRVSRRAVAGLHARGVRGSLEEYAARQRRFGAR